MQKSKFSFYLPLIFPLVLTACNTMTATSDAETSAASKEAGADFVKTSTGFSGGGATVEDIGGILELIEPLEERGALVRRSREALETEIERFTVMRRDGMIVACAALYPYPADAMAELACLAVHPSYQGNRRGDKLLEILETRAREQGIEALFVLTTQTAHWFRERGFEPVAIGSLPMKKQELYNFQRNSKVFLKRLE